MKKLDLVGQIFNRLTVIESLPIRKEKTWFKCVCICGNEIDVWGSALTTGQTQSCGCYQKDQVRLKLSKHGKTKTREYYSWVNMKTRCYNPKSADWKDYGGRGISVCERWLHSFENFYRDLGDKPKGMSLDRIKVNGNYEPKNCKWSTIIEQANNKRNIVFFDSNGLNMNLQGWANYFGVHQANLRLSIKAKGIDGVYDFYYKKYSGKFPDSGKFICKQQKDYNIPKAILAVREAQPIIIESKSIREMSRATGLHHFMIETSLKNGIAKNGWKFSFV